jgi:hypothetical protein
MNEDLPLIPAIIALLGVVYFAHEVEHRRHKLRQVFNVFDKQESAIAETLERMVESGELKPYFPGHPA